MPPNEAAASAEPTAKHSMLSGCSRLDNFELSNHSWLENQRLPPVNDSELHQKCFQVLELMEALDIDLGTLVWAINYGNQASQDCSLSISARKSFIRGPLLVPMLHNLYRPPRLESKGKQAAGARATLDGFALFVLGTTFHNEIRSYSKLPGVHIKDFAQTDRLKVMTYDRMESQAKEKCPTLFKVLHMLSMSVRRRGAWAYNERDSAFIAGISYETSQLSNNNFQKLLSVYFHAEHVPKAVVELLHRCNLCMSYSWTTKGLGHLAQDVCKTIVELARTHPIMGCHDNILFKFPVRSQRGNRQTVTDNGTAITMFVLPESAHSAFEDLEAIRVLRQCLESSHALGTAVSLSWSDLSDPQCRTQVFSHQLYHLFDILRSIPGVSRTGILADALLHHPPSWHTLPSGLEHRTQMFMLATRPIDETTYAGNLQVLEDALQQMGLDTGDHLVCLTLERMLAWVGDDMTIQRCRHLQWFRQIERNSWDRLDFLIFLFGWLHALMCLVHAMFECGRGSAAGLGFMRSVLKLGRAGFAENMGKKRPDYHNVVEFLMHEFEARVHGFWMWATGTNSIDELVAWVNCPERTAQEILDLGKRIQAQRVLSQAVSISRRSLDQHKDEVFVGTLATTRDLMIHWDLHHAVKHGHVGHMEDLIPELLIYFTGAKSKNYARQMYELLQLLRYETTPAIQEAIRSHCWLVNMSGRADSFSPVDMRQEHNNGGIRRHGPPPQGGSTWDEIGTASSVIPTFMDVVQQVEDSVCCWDTALPYSQGSCLGEGCMPAG
ncbi:hypothetical protein FRC08_001820 [Ceratobasidium sp. 394]|nr:hypothetical protein FRC08_001820 [Ceratobasidium sp. 394]